MLGLVAPSANSLRSLRSLRSNSADEYEHEARLRARATSPALLDASKARPGLPTRTFAVALGFLVEKDN